MNQFRKEKYRILIIDDEAFVRDILSDLLCDGYVCTTAASGTEALAIAESGGFEVVLSDIDLGDMNGVDIVPQILKSSPDTVVVMISGNNGIDHAIGAMRAGAFDYITKPFELDFVEIAVKRALDHHELLAWKRQYETHLEHLVKRRTDQLSYLAGHDALTDLPNRSLFEDKLEETLLRSGMNRRIAVLMLSLDGFKKIQDTLGHSIAALVLREIGRRLGECVGNTATVSRIEGDEFALLFSEFDADQEVIERVKEINSAIKQPINIENNEIFLTVSIGIGFFTGGGTDPQTMLTKTGTALLHAREDGGDNHKFYASGMDREALRRLAIENNFRHAIERGEIDVFYQPKVNVMTGRIIGMEALVRWRHPEFGLVSPEEFIPIAEESGMIIPLGEWVLTRACSDAQEMREAGFDLNLAVNLSLRQLQLSNLAETVMRILNETRFEARNLNLEITESSIMRNPDSAIETLGRLKQFGISISLDDFGTGYSSFGHLKRLPIDVLKIDKTFINDVTTDPDDASLTMAMVTLGHNLRLKVVAEGVETEEQLTLLNLLRCDEYQGYYFSKPLSAADFIKLLNGTLATA